MNTSLDHLPEDKRERIAAMAAKIHALVPEVGMILLFGSHARGDWVEDRETGYFSDYDLLAVVDDPSLARDRLRWAGVEAAVRPLADVAAVTLLVYELRELNQEIRRGQFFFAEIIGEAVVLYDSRRFTLARPKAATPEERRAMAEEYFEHWFESAGQFYLTFEDHLGRGWNPKAAFELHQSAERYFSAALLVFTGTKPRTHDLEALVTLVAPLHPLLARPFPHDTEQDEHLFGLLRRAYIEARYKKSYRITAEELAVLGGWVRDLAGRVERACREKIASFTAPERG
jgi:HEPN domain-containing protein/predicted nucleotidyltransferase